MSLKYRNEDLIGKKFGKLTIIEIGRKLKYGRSYRWMRCRCDCGKSRDVRVWHLLHGEAKSCGCSQGHVKHGFARRGFDKKDTSEYMLWSAAKRRAAKSCVAFTIAVTDITIPDRCPLLGLELKRNKGKTGPNSPSLDRIDSSGGYTPNNIWVISWKANRAKGDLTLQDLKKLVENFEHISTRMQIHETRT